MFQEDWSKYSRIAMGLVDILTRLKLGLHFFPAKSPNIGEGKLTIPEMTQQLRELVQSEEYLLSAKVFVYYFPGMKTKSNGKINRFVRTLMRQQSST